MRKIVLGIGLLVLIVQPGFAQKPKQVEGEFGLNGGRLFWGDRSTISSFGIAMRFSPDRSRYLDEIAFNLWHESHNNSTFFSLHVSRLFNIGKSRKSGLFIGPGFSVLLSLPIPIPHLKTALMIPLSKSIRIDLGLIFPFFMPFPYFSAGFSMGL